jgi:hypothetical protein
VADQKAGNIQLNDKIDRLDFIALRTAADAILPDPVLAQAALRVASAPGRLPLRARETVRASRRSISPPYSSIKKTHLRARHARHMVRTRTNMEHWPWPRISAPP